MYATYQVAGDEDFGSTALSRIALQVTASTGEILDKSETMVGMKENCATSIKVTNYLVFVACPSTGHMQVFRTDAMDNVDNFKVSTFTNEWDVVSSLSGNHVYLMLPTLGNNANRYYRLSIFEYVVDVNGMKDRRGDAPIFHQVLYSDAPFPLETSTNYGNVRISTSGRNLLVQQSKYDEI